MSKKTAKERLNLNTRMHTLIGTVISERQGTNITFIFAFREGLWRKENPLCLSFVVVKIHMA